MADKRRGLGRGIGALFPQGQEEAKNRPIDVFFNANENRKDAEATSVIGNDSPEVQSDQPAKKQTPAKKVASAKVDETKTKKKTTATSSSSKPSPTKKGTAEAKAPKDSSAAESTRVAGNDEQTAVESTEGLVPVPGATFGEIAVEQIVPNTKQPRQVFDEDDLAELTESIKEVGVLQPIVIRPLAAPLPEFPEARYELIMGERRWRASQLAGNATVPAIVRRTEDEDLLRDALLENLHRSQLNALEEAAAYQQLLEDFDCTHEELSRRIARSRPQISNTLRLLKLPPLVQRRVAAGVISAGHARALLGLTDGAAMERLAQRIVAEGLSVRAVEEIVAMGDEPAEHTRTRRTRIAQHELELNDLASRLADRLETRVKVNMGQRKGKISIDFANIEDLNRILELLDEREVTI